MPFVDLSKLVLGISKETSKMMVVELGVVVVLFLVGLVKGALVVLLMLLPLLLLGGSKEVSRLMVVELRVVVVLFLVGLVKGARVLLLLLLLLLVVEKMGMEVV